MPDSKSYENHINELNNELYYLKQQLQEKQLEATTYRQSLDQAQRNAYKQPRPEDLNPILQQIRNKNLSSLEKRELLMPVLYPSLPDDIYYQWVAPSRLVITRDRQWYWTIALLLMIMVLFAIILREMIWVAVILSFFLAIYVNSAIPAADTVYKLTRQGIELGEGKDMEIYSWQQMIDYSFYYKNKTEILYLDTLIGMPSRIQILFSQEDRRNISMVLEAHLPYKPVPKKQNWLTRMTEGIYIPIHDFKALQEKIDRYYDEKYAEILHGLQKQGKISDRVTVEDVRNAESIETLKIVDQMKNSEEDQVRRILGLK